MMCAPMHVQGRMLGWGREGIVKEGRFGGQPAALKFLIPELADPEDAVAPAAYLENELNAYAALRELLGVRSRLMCSSHAATC